MVEVMKLMWPPSKDPMNALPHSVLPTLQQATTNPYPCWRPPDTHRQVWASLLWGPCSYLLGPGAKGSVCALQESISQSCVNSGSSMVGLMATSSKRDYAKPKSAAPRAPAPAAAHCWPVPPQEMLKHSSFSVCGVPGSWCAQGLFEPFERLWHEWGLILKVNLPLLQSCWGFSFVLGREASPHSHCSWPWTWHTGS